MNGPRRSPTYNANADAVMVFGALAVSAAALGAVWGAAQLAAKFDHTSKPAANPIKFVADLAKAHYHWPTAATHWAIAEMVVVLAVVAVVASLVSRARGKKVYVDSRAQLMGRDQPSLRRYIDPKAAPVAAEHGPGLQIGLDVLSGRMVRATWEDTVVAIAGARMGKTTSMAVPQVLDAPGVVYATSNKRDLLDLTQKARAKKGKVWVFDPQGIAGTEEPPFWCDPLDACGDMMGARQISDVFASASRPPNATRDSYFDPAGEELLAMFLLAAAAAGKEPMTAVYNWVTNDRDGTPVKHLKDGGHLDLSAAADSTMHLPDRQRAGVFGTAAKIVAWMADPRLRAWVVDPKDGRSRLDVATVLADGSSAALYSLSKEGVRSAGALTGALTTTFLNEAERRGQVSPRGRLVVPVAAVLDEVANTCRWRDLPDKYSHYLLTELVLT